MSPKGIANQIVKRHPELRKLAPRQLQIVKRAIEEAAELSSREILSPKDTEREFGRLVPDSGKPSSALRAYRKRRELTQRDLSKKSGVPQPHIAAMESGKRSIGLIAAKKLALALGVDYRKLI
jgi:DNA-binding XRE family transcriptional regulator